MSNFINTVNSRLSAQLESALAERLARIAAMQEMTEEELYAAMPAVSADARKAETERRLLNTACWTSKDTDEKITFVCVERGIRNPKTAEIVHYWYKVTRIELSITESGELTRNTVNSMYISKIGANSYSPVTDKAGLTAVEQAIGQKMVEKAYTRTDEGMGYGFGFNELTNTLRAIKDATAKVNRAIKNAAK
jgi:hypothetical protein